MDQHSSDERKEDKGGTNDPGKNGEDKDILGIPQDDLSSDDLKGDGRREKPDLPGKESDDLGDFA